MRVTQRIAKLSVFKFRGTQTDQRPTVSRVDAVQRVFVDVFDMLLDRLFGA